MMNRKTLGICLAAIFLPASLTWAAITPESLSVGIFGGEYLFKHKEYLHPAPVYGIKAGYDFTKYFGMEISGEGLQTKINRDSRVDHKYRVSAYNARLDSLIYLMPDSAIVPYVSVGVGGRSIDSPQNSTDYRYSDTTRNFLADAGLGVKMFITERLALRGDLRSLFIFNNNKTIRNEALHTSTQNFEGMLGLMYVMGGKKPVKDSDNDGVADDKDQCPSTPAYVQVDAIGCPIDSDNDGVADYLDKCPDTLKGAQVDGRGCPMDSDNDGVADYLDKCPGTPFGTKVDSVGCEIPAPVPIVPVPAPTIMEQAIIEQGRATLDIKFKSGKVDIQPQYHDELAEFADIMKKHPDLKVTIEGHTDSIGEAPDNLKLSQRRAESVKAYLIGQFGIDADRLNAKGFGESKPIADNMIEAGRMKNRRVEAAVDYTIEKTEP